MEALSVYQNLSFVDEISLFANVHQFKFESVRNVNHWALAGIFDEIKLGNWLMGFDPLLLSSEEDGWVFPAHEFNELITVFAEVLNNFFVVKKVVTGVYLFNLIIRSVISDSDGWIHQDSSWFQNIGL
jgi:hypothetical protein